MTTPGESPKGLGRHLPVAQGLIAILTGLITIGGAGYSVYKYFAPPPDKAEIVAVVKDDQSGKPLQGAKVEVLSARKALVATLEPDADGRVRYTLKEGTYDLRVACDGYGTVTREIQLTPGQNVDLTVKLAASGSPIRGLGNAVKKLVGR